MSTMNGRGERNVKTYGAVGDGVTDDTAAISSARTAAAAGNDTLWWPAGTYLTDPIALNNGEVWSGPNNLGLANKSGDVVAPSAAVIKLKTGANAHFITVADVAGRGQIRNLSFDGNAANQTLGDVLHLSDAASAQQANWLFEDVYVKGAKANGVYVGKNRLDCWLTRVIVDTSGNDNFQIHASDTKLYGCGSASAGRYGANIGDSVQAAWVVRLTDCDIWSSTLANVIVQNDSEAISLVGCGIDSGQQQGLYVANTSAVQVINCRFASNSQSGAGSFASIETASTGTVNVIGTLFNDAGTGIKPSFDIKVDAGALLNEYGNISNSSSVSGYLTNAGTVSNKVQQINNAGTYTGTSSNSRALAVGQTGVTNPAFAIDASAGVGTGVAAQSAGAGSGATIAAISSGTDENLILKSKGAGTALIEDGSGNIVAAFAKTASAVASIKLFNAATGGYPIIQGTGETNTGITLQANGTGQVQIVDGSFNKGFVVNHSGSAVNNLQANNSISGSPVSLQALGSDNNIGISLTPKGTGACTITQFAEPSAAMATTATVTLANNLSGVQTLTPTQAMTINAGTSVAGEHLYIIVTTSGTSAFVVTFGTNFKATGTLSTGSVTAKTFTLHFVSNGTNYCEMSRTVAM